jgi:branched-chain amino acid transport system substrate-binding protein
MKTCINVLIWCAGCCAGPGAWSTDSIRIASIFARTGVAADDNAQSIKGVREAVQEINGRGGVLGRKLELIELDNLSTPIGSKLAAESAVKQEVTAILGAAWSSHTLAMAPVAQASGTPLISTISTNEEVTRTGDYIFRVCFTDAFQGRIMAKFARETLHAKSAVTVTDLTSDYGLGLTREFEANFQNLGGHITRRLDYRIKQADFKELAMEVKAAAPQVVFIPGYWESAVIIQAIRATGSAPIFMGGDGWGTERFFERGGTDIPKVFYSTHWAEDIETNQSRACRHEIFNHRAKHRI